MKSVCVILAVMPEVDEYARYLMSVQGFVRDITAAVSRTIRHITPQSLRRWCKESERYFPVKARGKNFFPQMNKQLLNYIRARPCDLTRTGIQLEGNFLAR